MRGEKIAPVFAGDVISLRIRTTRDFEGKGNIRAAAISFLGRFVSGADSGGPEAGKYGRTNEPVSRRRRKAMFQFRKSGHQRRQHGRKEGGKGEKPP